MEKYIFAKLRKRLIKKLKNDENFLVEESKRGIEDLVKINKLGILTIDSQPGSITMGEVPDNLKLYRRLTKKYYGDSKYKRSRYIKKGGTFHHGVIEKQRAYLCGFIKEKYASKFENYMNSLDNIIAWTTTDGKEKNMGIYVTYGLYSPFVNEGDLVGWTNLGNYYENMSDFIFIRPEEKNILDSSKDNYSCIYVMDSRFGHDASSEDGLFKKVIEFWNHIK